MKNTLQTLLTQHIDDYRQKHGLSFDQSRAVTRLMACRTQALGGHTQMCPNGHVQGVWYNSCKHRACPQCCGLPRERWLQKISSVLLDCPHHHMIFTLPSELHGLWRFNRVLMSDLLFQAVQHTLQTFSQDKRYLGASPGVMSALHTWGRDLSLHPHLHCLITHGGVSTSGEWVKPKKRVLFPQEPLMMVYRGKLLALVRAALLAKEMRLPAPLQSLINLLNKLGRKDWVVHCCKRYEHGKGVANYLARYMRGGPFNNRQLVNVTDRQVTFSYQSHVSHKREILRLPVDTFISRWLEHVPQSGKALVRYCGLYSSASRDKLNQAREYHQQAPVSLPQLVSWQTYLSQWTEPRCEVCGCLLHHQEEELIRHAA